MYEWDEAKREANLRKHRLDFRDAYLVYDSPKTVSYTHLDVYKRQSQGSVVRWPALLWTRARAIRR